MNTTSNTQADAFDAELLAKITGKRRAVGGHRPFLIEDSARVWLVLKGQLDVYAIEMAGDTPVSIGRHVMSIGAGSVIFGVQSLQMPHGGSADRLALRAVAAMGTELYEGSAADLQGEDFDIIVVDWIDRWVGFCARAMMQSTIPRGARALEAEPEMAFEAGTDVCAQFGDVVWVTLDAGAGYFTNRNTTTIAPGGPALPLTEQTWLHLCSDSIVSAIYTPTALFRGRLWDGLEHYHALLMPLLHQQINDRRRQETERSRARWIESEGRFGGALQALGSVVRPELGEAPQTATQGAAGAHFGAFAAVMEAKGVQARQPQHGLTRRGVVPLREFARASGVRMRQVSLTDVWWKSDSGPLFGQIEDGARPVALLPTAGGAGYDMFDPTDGSRIPVNASLAATLDFRAYMFYLPFPARALGVLDVLAFGLSGLRRELWLVFGLGILAGILGLAMPIAIGHLFSNVVPRADINTFVAVIAALTLTALGVFVFDVSKGLAMLRVTGKMDGRIQSAVWDRLLALPLSFFKAYTAGDLADRANSINAIREVLTGAALQSVFSVVFSLFSFGLLFYYSWELALVATGLIMVVLVATALFTWAMMPHKHANLEVLGKVEGQVFQFLDGIAKLRTSSSESRAFARWASLYRQSKFHALAAARLNAGQETFNAAFPVGASIVIFAYMHFKLNGGDAAMANFSIGAFLSFNAALGQFNASIMAFTAAASQIIEIVPLYRRADPILKAIPEMKPDALDPGDLSGAIEISNVTFRYEAETPPVLKNFSLAIRPGEFVAFVGASGSGKSTIIRLLLGFEQPESGGIYYDGQDLSGLNVGAVRRQIGVVLQGSRLSSGSIFECIVGSSQLTNEDAREAARAAGLEDDISAMPMGMHTVVSEGASTFSGGQKQRLLIARALAQKPRLLILDEATSALDNRTQAIVNESLQRENLTRIVVAHRLTTIVNADRIIVLGGGIIQEEGRYAELISRDGPFAAMARRQIL